MSAITIFYFYSQLFNCLFSMSLGLFVLYKSPNKLANRTWCFSTLAVGVWSLFFALTISENTHDQALLYNKICNIAAAYIPVFLTHFCLAITEQRSSKNLLLKLGYINCFVITFLAFTNALLDVRPISIFTFYPQARSGYYFYTVHFFFFFFYQEYLLYKS